MNNKLDIIAFGSHPDDVELGCGGTLLSHIAQGKYVGIVDLTYGELATRGTVNIRKKESAEASRIMGISIRENLGFADGFFTNDKTHQLRIIQILRKYRPDIVLANALSDRHPDHSRGGRMVSECCYLSGLRKIKTKLNGKGQEAFAPRAVYHYEQYRQQKPDIVVDISTFFNKKMEAIKAHKSQFYNPKSKEPQTVISAPDFFKLVEAKAISSGKQIGVKYGEGFTAERFIGTSDLFNLI